MFSKGYEWEEYLWARHIVDSRSWLVREGVVALVPVADLANHVASGPLVNMNQDEQMAVVTANSAIRAGEQIFFSYGRKSNSHLMLHYGFVIPENEDDVLQMSLDFNGDSPFDETKREIFRQVGVDSHITGAINTYGIDSRIVLFLRIAYLTPHQFMDVNRAVTQGNPICLENERRVLIDLISKVEAFREQYRPLEEDLRSLRGKKNLLATNMRNILTYRIGESQLLKNARDRFYQDWDDYLLAGEDQILWDEL
jgi:hypothetical protein